MFLILHDSSVCAVPKKNNVCFHKHLSNYCSASETAYFFGSCPDLHFLLNASVWNTSRHGFKMGCKPLFEHFFLVFSSGAVCTQWHVEWCINRLKWSDPEIEQAVWLALTEMKTSSGGLLCADMFILLCCELRISEELQDKAVIRLHHHCLESRTLFTSFDT